MEGIVLVSGGLDSTLSLLELLSGGHVCTPMFVDYKQWPAEGEWGAVVDVIQEIKTGFGFPLYQCGSAIRVEVDFLDRERIGSAWGRGIALVGLAAMWAYTHGDCYDFVALGNHLGDVGPDCRPGDFDKLLGDTLSAATRGKMQLLLPISNLTTVDVGLKLSEYRIPWESTYSCYWWPPCGYKSKHEHYRCPGCRRKALAMEAAGTATGQLLDLPNSRSRSYQSLLAEEAGY